MLFTDGRFGKNPIIVGDYMRSSVHVDNKTKDILTLDKRPRQGLDDITLQGYKDTAWTAEPKYIINITHSVKRFVFSLHYKRSNSFLFANATNVYRFKVKNSEINNYSLCLGNVSKYFTINNLKKRG